MKNTSYLCVLFVPLLLAGCRQRYEAPVVSPATGYLVIDGVLNGGAGTAAITLTRTTMLNDSSHLYETGAVVSLQAQDSAVIVLSEKGKGTYGADNLLLSKALQYRLRINTKDGSRYLSDFVPVRNNPPVDSLSWRIENGGVQLYINSHDPLNNTHYYQWTYEETWQIQSAHSSSLKYKIVRNGGDVFYTVAYRDSSTFSIDTSIINCWQFNNPLNIFIASTAKLSQDVVSQPVAFIPPASVKLGVKYSISVKQYTWSKEGYEFLDRLRKNTETTGSVFDPQPSELNTNIHNLTNPADRVIGFFNICSVQEKRIFIARSDVPGWGYSPGCFEITLPNISDSIAIKGASVLPTLPVKKNATGEILIFGAAPPDCVDCTLRGTNKRPGYWQ